MTIKSTIDAMLKTCELEEIIKNGRIKLRATHQDVSLFRKVHASIQKQQHNTLFPNKKTINTFKSYSIECFYIV